MKTELCLQFGCIRDVNIFIKVYMYECVYVCKYVPIPLKGQDMTYSQFFSGIFKGWIQSFPSRRLIA